MKKMLFLAILSCIGAMAFAQKVYFVYIQSEAGTPFYVKMGEKVYSSTASGYIILPKLKDSTYSLYLGQPGNQMKELRFSVAINNADHGFLLKNFQDGWALFDLQSMAVISPTPSTSGVMYESNTVKSDLFTRLLAKAVDDSTLLMEPVLAKRDEPKQSLKEDSKKKALKDKNEAVVKVPEEIAPVPATSTSDTNMVKEAANNNTVAKSEDAASKQAVVPNEPVVPEETSAPKDTVTAKVTMPSQDTSVLKETTSSKETVSKEITTSEVVVEKNAQKVDSNPAESNTPKQTEFKRSVVKKYAESSNFQGFGLTFIDTWEGMTDTIRLMIPNVVDASALFKPEQPKIDKQESNEAIKDTQSLKDNQVSASVVTKERADSQTTDVNDAAVLANCKEVASNKDFLELRKNMASKDRGEEMLVEARKAFNEKCYTTEQVRKLSVLFYTQEGKFLFFKDAKPYVSDKDRFNTLVFELNEDSYQERFKSLLEN